MIFFATAFAAAPASASASACFCEFVVDSRREKVSAHVDDETDEKRQVRGDG